jgi:hypothetical protein
MDGIGSRTNLRSLGAQLAKYVRDRPGSSAHSISAMQSVIADLTADQPDIGTPLRDLVARTQFQTLIPLAASGTGEIQRNALIGEVRRIYNPDVVFALQEFLNGFLECSGGSGAPAQRVPDPIASTPTPAPPVSAAPVQVSLAREAPLPRRRPPLVENNLIEAGHHEGQLHPDPKKYGFGFNHRLLVAMFFFYLILALVCAALVWGPMAGVAAVIALIILLILVLLPRDGF